MRYYRKNYPDKIKHTAKKTRTKQRFGISLDEYELHMKSTNGKCYICGIKPKRVLCCDHNHKTGDIRKPLCHKCNMLVGIYENTPELLVKISEYVIEHNIPKSI